MKLIIWGMIIHLVGEEYFQLYVIIRYHDDVLKWIRFPRYRPLCGEFTGLRWIPHTQAGDAERWYFPWSAPEQTAE